jgi:hypothetical protein
MDRQFYLDLAQRGICMPIGTDLVMHEEAEPEKVRNDGPTLGRVIARAARRWGTPLAVPLMDLRLEKIDMLSMASVTAQDAEAFHFKQPLTDAELVVLLGEQSTPLCPGSAARDEALRFISTQQDLIPVGMAIGPFSLTTRLMDDPISAAAMFGAGMEPTDSAEVKLLLQCLQISEAAVWRAVQSQIAHGARVLMICEPTASTAFISPRQMRAGSKLFERLVMEPNLRLKAAMEAAGCDLIFHNCGELIDPMVEAFGLRLHPVMLSLGSSRKLWEDARLVPADVVLFGNLPSKSFYSDGAMPVDEVIRRTEELLAQMKACGHPHILGSECDVLYVPEAREAILSKVEAMRTAPAVRPTPSAPTTMQHREK